MFDAIRSWLEVRAAMKAARRMRVEQTAMNNALVTDKLNHVRLMTLSGQRAFAINALDEVLLRYPEEAADDPNTIDALMNLQRLEEAEQLALRGMLRHPDCRPFMEHYGHVADRRGDLRSGCGAGAHSAAAIPRLAWRS